MEGIMMKIRKANQTDLSSIVRLLADDELGVQREHFEEPLPAVYKEAFHAIESQVGNQVLVAVDQGDVIGCLQLTMIPGLSRLGMKRAQIEGVRIDRNYRRKKIGENLIEEAIQIAQSENCGLVQLTTDKERQDAYRFYERLGFTASHEGMKLLL